MHQYFALVLIFCITILLVHVLYVDVSVTTSILNLCTRY